MVHFRAVWERPISPRDDAAPGPVRGARARRDAPHLSARHRPAAAQDDEPASRAVSSRPGAWARADLAERGVAVDEVALPDQRDVPPRLGRAHGAAHRRRGRADAGGRGRWPGAALDRHRPSAVVVIQDTLLLERFLVREANARGLPDPGGPVGVQLSAGDVRPTRELSSTGGRRQQRSRHCRDGCSGQLTRAAYHVDAARARAELRLSCNSYGGGEAELFAVMGDGVPRPVPGAGRAGKRDRVTGHPTHDIVFQRAQSARRRRPGRDPRARTVSPQIGPSCCTRPSRYSGARSSPTRRSNRTFGRSRRRSAGTRTAARSSSSSTRAKTRRLRVLRHPRPAGPGASPRPRCRT